MRLSPETIIEITGLKQRMDNATTRGYFRGRETTVSDYPADQTNMRNDEKEKYG